MTRTIKTILLNIAVALCIILVTILAYSAIISQYPYDIEDRLEGYYTTQMLIQCILVACDIHAILIFSIVSWCCRDKLFKEAES